MKNLREFIDKSVWTFSKRMKNIPHEYIFLGAYPDNIKPIFTSLVRYIQTTENGFYARFLGRVYKYIQYGDYYYWTMGCPPEETIIINRARIADYNLKTDIKTGNLYMEVNKKNVL